MTPEIISIITVFAFEFPVHLPKKLGRKPVKGKRIELRKLLEDPKQTWVSLNVNWYGGIQKTIECLSFTCLWYHAGEPPVTLRIVLVKRGVTIIGTKSYSKPY